MTEIQRFMTDNHNLIYGYLRDRPQYTSVWGEDSYGIAAIGFCKASHTYNENLGKFSCYAYKCMDNSFKEEIRKEQCAKSIPKCKLEYYEASSVNGDAYDEYKLINTEDLEENVLIKVLFKDISRNITHRDKKILSLLAQGYTQSQISNFTGLSQAKISRIKTKIRSMIAF